MLISDYLQVYPTYKWAQNFTKSQVTSYPTYKQDQDFYELQAAD